MGCLTVGIGDQLMATGMARGAAARGRRIAFGDGRRILWDGNSEPIFRGNPNIAPPGSERAPGIDWIAYYKGHRIYNRHVGGRWVWNHDFRPIAGEVFLTDAELAFGKSAGKGFVVIEPHVPRQKSCAPNKDWGFARYAEVAKRLARDGFDVVQFAHGEAPLPFARQVATPSFRHALAVLERAALYIGPEGGLHHGAAAMGTAAVVIFGGFIPPAVTGYTGHANLTGGAEACGSLRPCRHCREALDRITVDEVVDEARSRL